MTQTEKATRFRDFHHDNEAFIIPNPWDVGTARLLAHLGFAALATTSAGYAFSRGQVDNAISRDEMLGHIHSLAMATDLPVSADLGNGFGDQPEQVAQTIRLAAEAGAVGGSIEDATRDEANPLYEEGLAVDRIRAASSAARELSFPFTLTARCEDFLVGGCDLDKTIRRLQAYRRAGADVVYAPGLKTYAEIAAVVSAISCPVNVLMGASGSTMDQAQLSSIGVRRISVGSALSRAALGAFFRAAQEMKNQGTFTYVEQALSYPEITRLLS
jgi:2-methylisocitrate lyase-like PEP mutase family enzyme